MNTLRTKVRDFFYVLLPATNTLARLKIGILSPYRKTILKPGIREFCAPIKQFEKENLNITDVFTLEPRKDLHKHR